jgi:ABC-2 type transport system ATP-binding protein
VILTTHDMDDIEALCSRVLLIDGGRILLDDTLEGLRRQVSSERRLILDLVEENGAFSDPQVRLLRQEGRRVELAFDPDQVPAAALISRLTARCAVRDLFVENPPIEEIIAHLYRRNQA